MSRAVSQLGTRGTLILAAEEDDEFEVFAIQGDIPRSTQRGHVISEYLLKYICGSPRWCLDWDAGLTHLGEQI